MLYYFIPITDTLLIAAIVFIWLMIFWNILLASKVGKLRAENRATKEKLSNLHVVCEFQEDLIKQQESNSNFTDGLY